VRQRRGQSQRAFSARTKKPPVCHCLTPPAVPIQSSLVCAYALSFARPFARRAFRILRPALVAMRARNPWRFLRTRFDGWNVRFIACSPSHGQIRTGDSKPFAIQTRRLSARLAHVNAHGRTKLQQLSSADHIKCYKFRDQTPEN